MKRWTLRKFMFHAALVAENPFGWFLTDDFSHWCECGRDLHNTAVVRGPLRHPGKEGGE